VRKNVGLTLIKTNVTNLDLANREKTYWDKKITLLKH